MHLLRFRLVRVILGVAEGVVEEVDEEGKEDDAAGTGDATSLFAERRAAFKAESTFTIAILMRSAALPWMGVLMASRSAPCRAVAFLESMSRSVRRLPRMVSA